jgi:antirestriction protein ArdC
MQASDLHEKVTNQMIAELEKGTVLWVKPWKGGNGGILPINAATHRYYSGINVLILWAEREEKGYPTPEWMTFTKKRYLRLLLRLHKPLTIFALFLKRMV